MRNILSIRFLLFKLQAEEASHYNANVSRATFKRFNVSIFFAKKLSTIIYLTNQAMIPESGITRRRQSKSVHRLPFFLSRPHTVSLLRRRSLGLSQIRDNPKERLRRRLPYRAIFHFALYPTWEPVHRLGKCVAKKTPLTRFRGRLAIAEMGGEGSDMAIEVNCCIFKKTKKTKYIQCRCFVYILYSL